jgi:ribosomal-protein-alanine acetyltransferase
MGAKVYCRHEQCSREAARADVPVSLPLHPAIRAGGADDLAALVGLERAGFAPERAWSFPLLRMELGAPHSLVLVAEERISEERCLALGYAAFRIVADEAELLRVTVAPEARRRGVARALVEAGLAEAARRGADRCFLEVRPDNPTAVRLYETLGFREAGRRAGYYHDGSDALVMRRG